MTIAWQRSIRSDENGQECDSFLEAWGPTFPHNPKDGNGEGGASTNEASPRLLFPSESGPNNS